MSTITAISPSVHSRKSWRPTQSLGFIAREALIVIGYTELSRTLTHLPIAFIRQGDAINVAAVVGLLPEQNLMIGSDGQWLGGYVPFRMRSYPFTLAPAPTGELVLCIIEGDGNVMDGPVANPFFDSVGQLDPVVKQTMEALATFEREKAACRNCAAQLDAMGVLKPWELTAQTYLGSKKIEGLWRADEATLNALPDSDFLELRKTGALTLAYCQMLSQPNMERLMKLAQKAPLTAAVASTGMELDFSRLGG